MASVSASPSMRRGNDHGSAEAALLPNRLLSQFTRSLRRRPGQRGARGRLVDPDAGEVDRACRVVAVTRHLQVKIARLEGQRLGGHPDQSLAFPDLDRTAANA